MLYPASSFNCFSESFIMFLAILLLILTGIIWVGIGAVVDASAQKGSSLDFIQGMAALLMMLIGSVVWFFGDSSVHPLTLAFLPMAGVINYVVFVLAKKAMACGPSGLTWAIMQSSFVMPFLMGVFFFNVPCSLLRGSGIAVLFTSMFFMGSGAKIPDNTNGTPSSKSTWIFYTLLAFLAAGICQCCSNIPSYFIKEASNGLDNLLFRSGINSTGAFLCFLLSPVWNKKAWRSQNCLKSVGLFFASTLTALCCLYKGLDLLAAREAGAIGYPIALGATIAAFLFYSSWQLKEKLTPTALLGVLLCLCGIVLVLF